jgi:ATP-binding cassette subfamily C protein LapB
MPNDMKNNSNLFVGAMALLLRLIKLILIPILAIIEAALAFFILSFYALVSAIEKIRALSLRYVLPAFHAMVNAFAAVIAAMVQIASAVHAFLNQPAEAFAKPIAPVIKAIHWALTPVYVLLRMVYQLLASTYKTVARDLGIASRWLGTHWSALTGKPESRSKSDIENEGLSKKYSVLALEGKYLNAFNQYIAQLGEQFNQFSAELKLVYGQAGRLFQNKGERDAVDSLSAFVQERNTIITASVIINVLALAFPLLMLQLYDRILAQRSIDTLIVFCVGVGVAIALESVIRIFRSYATAWISARFEHQGYVSLTSRLLAEPINEFERKGTGTILEEYKSISTLRYHYSGQTFQQLMDLPFTALYLLIIFFISPLIGLLLFVGYSIFIFITWQNWQD